MNIYNIGLTPTDTATTDLIIDYSKRLNDQAGSTEYVLSPERRPHATVVQVESDKDPAVIWEKIAPYAENVDINPTGLSLIPTSKPTICWIELGALKTGKLGKLQDQILFGLGRESNGSIRNATDDSYRPHITVALCTPPKDLPLPPPLPRVIPCQLYLAESGPNFSLGKILYRHQ